jgi:four helix bundle protein
MTHNPNRLTVIAKAKQLAVGVHEACDRHRASLKQQTPTLRTQLLRATDSILLNLAEGARKESTASFIYFLDIAIASCNEVEVQLELALSTHAIPTAAPLLDQVIEVRRMSIGLRKRLVADGKTTRRGWEKVRPGASRPAFEVAFENREPSGEHRDERSET